MKTSAFHSETILAKMCRIVLSVHSICRARFLAAVRWSTIPRFLLTKPSQITEASFYTLTTVCISNDTFRIKNIPSLYRMKSFISMMARDPLNRPLFTITSKAIIYLIRPTLPTMDIDYCLAKPTPLLSPNIPTMFRRNGQLSKTIGSPCFKSHWTNICIIIARARSIWGRSLSWFRLKRVSRSVP